MASILKSGVSSSEREFQDGGAAVTGAAVGSSVAELLTSEVAPWNRKRRENGGVVGDGVCVLDDAIEKRR